MFGKKLQQPPLNYAMNLLARRRYSEREIRDRLSKKKVGPEECEKTVNRLKELRLINDSEFANLFIEAELRRAPQGTISLRQRLQRKGLSPIHIQMAMQNFPLREHDLAKKALEKKLRTFKTQNETVDSTKRTQQMYRFLISRGFTPPIAIKTIEEHSGQASFI